MQAALVQRIFTLYVDRRLGSATISGQLNDAGQLTSRGHRWTPNRILGVLRNPTYLGQLLFNGERHQPPTSPSSTGSCSSRHSSCSQNARIPPAPKPPTPAIPAADPACCAVGVNEGRWRCARRRWKQNVRRPRRRRRVGCASCRRCSRAAKRPAVLRRAHGSYASRVAEAGGYAHEPWRRVAEHLGHHTDVGTGELNPLAVGRRKLTSPSNTSMGK
jgi:hypothetical protein